MLPALAALSLAAQPLAFRRYDNRDGLPGSQILGLLEDRQGFLWVANNNALARLGPHGFQVFHQVADSTPRGVSALLEDRRQSVWAATPESGLLEIRGSRVRAYGPSQGLPQLEVYALAEPPGGVLHVATRRGLFRKQGERFEPVPLPPPLRETPVYALAGDARGRLWMGGRQGFLARWNGETLTRFTPPQRTAKDWISQILPQPGNGLWVLTRTALTHVTEEGLWEEIPLPGLGPILPRSMHLSADGELLIALGVQGLALRHPDGRTQLLSGEDGIPASGVYSVLRDRRGTLWLGTEGEYLIAQSLPGLRSLDIDLETRASLGLGAVMAILEERRGQFLLGSAHGLFRWERSRGLLRRWGLKQGLPSSDVFSFAAHPDGSTILATARGLARLQGDRLGPFAPELRQSLAYALAPWRGRLWVATDQGLAELQPDGALVKLHKLPPEAGGDMVACLAPSPERLLLGTRRGLFAMFPGGTKPLRFAADAPFTHRSLYSLRLAPDGRMMVGTDGGLFVQEGSGWRHLQEGKELLSGGVSWSVALPDGTLAVGHGRGVSLVDRDGSLHLTRNLGLISDETNQEAVLVDRSGLLWFGMVGGVCSLDPRMLPQRPKTVAPVVREASWDDQHALYPRTLQLPAGGRPVTLSFDLPYPGCPTPPQYQVRLDGDDRGWLTVPPGTLSHPLVDLRGGAHRFHLRASLDGVQWTEAAPLTLLVARAWHQFWVSRFLLLCTGLGILGALLRVRTRALERSNAQLEQSVAVRTEELALRNQSLERLHGQLKANLESRIRLMNTVTHDLRSPLTSILLSVDLLQGGASEKALAVIGREARRLEGILASMLDKSRHEAFLENLNPRVCHPTEILSGLADTLTLRAETQGLRATLELDPRSDEVWILADIPSIQQVLFNLLENALKFTTAPGGVGLRTLVATDTFAFEVWDTGRGIAPEHLARIFSPFEQAESDDRAAGWGLGLSICKELVEAHQGRIDVESQPRRGARFRVTLPLLNPQESHQDR